MAEDKGTCETKKGWMYLSKTLAMRFSITAYIPKIKHKLNILCLNAADSHSIVAGVALLLTSFARAPVGMR